MADLRAPAAIGLLAASAVLIASCGGDSRRATQSGVSQRTSSQPASTTPAIPVVPAPVSGAARRAYIARVDSVCKRLDAERNSARERAAANSRQLASHYDDSIALGRQELSEIEAIKPPRGDEQALRVNVFDVISRQLDVRKKISAAVAAGENDSLAPLQSQLDDLTRSLVGFARGYGFQVCGTD